MYRDASRESADSKLLEDYTLEDLDDNTIREYKGLWKKIHPFHPFNNLETKEFLKKINVLKTNRKSNKECLTLAGLLVFGKHESIKCKCQFKYVKKIQNKNVHFIHLPFGKNL
jgi:divergent AAA domain protein